MTETITHRTERADSITIGRVSKGGELKVYIDADDLADAQRRISNIVRARAHFLEQLAGTGIS
ncbi:MAG: hypothetical protein NTV84_06610 [Methanoregula sp.]|nr:hypothetical protein [Methanoregula sp.]